jgi:hypothetical protein
MAELGTIEVDVSVFIPKSQRLKLRLLRFLIRLLGPVKVEASAKCR